MANKKTISTEVLEKLIGKKNTKALSNIFIKVPAIDIAEACNELSPRNLIYLFRNIKSEYTAEVFEELDIEAQEKLIASMTNKELVEIINQQSADDIVDAVVCLPANLVSRVLKAADADMRKDINRLLRYEEGTAGAIMTTEYLNFSEDMKAEDAINAVRSKGRDAETVYTIFVKNRYRRFVGTVDLDDLIFAKKDDTLKDIMNQDVVSVKVNTDQEEASKLFRRYDLHALAVLNDDDCIIGIITIDDAVDVLTEETTEDIQKMNAVQPIEDEYLKTSAFVMTKKCVPWIILLIVLGTFSSIVLSHFQSKLVEFSTLAIFLSVITVITDTGGNAGGQSNALMVRGLALNEFGAKDYLKILWKEIKNAFLIGLCVCGFAILWFLFEQYFGLIHNPATDVIVDGEIKQAFVWNGLCWTSSYFFKSLLVSSVIGFSLFCTVFVAKIVGISLPIFAAALKKDPALMSAPFITTIVDIVSLLIYFGLIMLFMSSIEKVQSTTFEPETLNSICSSLNLIKTLL